MINKENIDKEFWKAIGTHYEKECYEDTLKDACLYIIELIQEKSENYDLDGEKLINNIFSEKNPKLLINKNQTNSEKDEQRGYGYIIKGLICAIRNPLSHNKNIKYSKETTDSILLFINFYILPKLDDTKEFGYVDNWFDFVFLDNDNDSEKISNKILDSINKKDKFILMKNIVENLTQIKEGKYFYFINTLYESLSLKCKNEIIVILNRKLIKAKDDRYLRMFFNHFDPKIWNELDGLVTVRIEEMVTDSIRSGKIVISQYSKKEELADAASLSTWVHDWIKYFSNYDVIKEILLRKINNKEEAKYVFKYFYSTVYDHEFILENSSEIIKGLKKKKYYFKELIETAMFFGDDTSFDIFREEYEKVKDLKEPEVEPEEYPF